MPVHRSHLSMSTATMSHPSFSIPIFAQLVQRLRHTNARYHQIAHQCRHTQHPTHHAKRRAYRAGLHVDTSKACAAWPTSSIVSVASVQLLPHLDSLVWGSRETKLEEAELDANAEHGGTPTRLVLALKNCSPEVVVRKQPLTICDLSPLWLGLGSNVNVDNSDACDLPLPIQGPVPGAPRWRPIPLPEDEGGMKAMTFANSVSCTYGPNVWRGGMGTHVSDSVSTPVDVVHYTGLGIVLSPRHPKRTLRDVEADRRAMLSRQPDFGGPNDGCFLGASRSKAKRRRGGL